MSEIITVEGKTLNEAIGRATQQLGAVVSDEIRYEFVREHFRGGAYTVQISASMRSEEDLAGRANLRARADQAAQWMRDCLNSFGSEAQVRAVFKSEAELLVEVQCEQDGRLLIGKEGRNLKAFELLLASAVLDGQDELKICLDVEGYRSRSRSPRRDEDRPRRDDRGGRGRGRDRDRGSRRPRREGDAERDQAIHAETRSAVERILAGEEQSLVLSEMNSYERHLAHTVVKEVDGVDSRSVGSGSDRRVEVFAR